MKIQAEVLRVVMLCSDAVGYLQGLHPEDGDSKVLRNVGNLHVSQPKRPRLGSLTTF